MAWSGIAAAAQYLSVMPTKPPVTPFQLFYSFRAVFVKSQVRVPLLVLFTTQCR